MATRTELLQDLGRSEFTVRQMAERAGVSIEAARSRLSRYLEQGLVERTSDVLQYVDAKGRPQRGRPSHLYRVR
jgi:predicted ArsR family transcriptional regulator